MLHTMITASNPHFKGKISSLLEELLAAAVTEICELFDNEFASVTLRAECPKCKHSKEAERPNLTPRRSSPSRNLHKFSSRDEDPQGDCSRGEFERNITLNSDVADQQIIPQCSQWDMGGCYEQSKHDGKEMATKIELVSIKQEVLEDCELQAEVEGGEEGVTGLDISLPGPGLNTTVSPQTESQWPPPESFVHADSNGDPTFESENGHSCSINKDELSENSGLGDIDIGYDEQQQEPSTWNSDMTTGPESHHAFHPNVRRDCGRVRQEETQRAQVELGNQHFPHWAMSALRTQTYLHKQWSRCRKTPGHASVHNVNLSGAVSIDTRASGSGNHRNMSLTVTEDQEKRFTCQLCGKRLLSEQTLKSHQKIHTGYAPHQCNQCGKRFSRLENLKVHQNIHTGLKPYTCKFCLKKFNAPSNFNRHKRACLKRKLTQFSS